MNKVALFALFALLLPLTPAFSEEPRKVKEVVVTATRTERSPEEIAEDVTVITRREIRDRSYRTVKEVLSEVPGLTVTAYGNRGALATPSLRGSTAGQVLILLDGKRLNSPASGQFDLNTLLVPLETIERVEVLRGASSALYGAEAMGGVINIITRIPDTPEARLSTYYGSRNTRHYTLSASGLTSEKAGKIGYVFGATKEESDGFRENTDYRLWGVIGKLSYALSDETKITLNADYGYRSAGVPGSETFPTPEDRQRDVTSFVGAAVNVKTFRFDLYRHYGKLFFFTPFSDTSIKTTVTGGALQHTLFIGSAHALTSGVERLFEKATGSEIGEQERTRTGVFVQDEFTALKNVTLTAGVRYDDFDRGSRVTPRVSVLYRPFETTALRGAAGKGYRIPTFNDLFWPDSGFAAGNPSLKPEKSTEYELSIEQQLLRGLTAKALVFHKEVKDLIQWAPDAAGKWMPTNIAEARIRGAEVTVDLAVAPFAFFASYYYQDPTDVLTGEKILFMPRHTIKGTLVYKTRGGFTASLEEHYVSHYMDRDSHPRSWSYGVLNGKVSQELKLFGGKATSELFLIGKNLLNKKYSLLSRDGSFWPMPPVEVFGGLAVRF